MSSATFISVALCANVAITVNVNGTKVFKRWDVVVTCLLAGVLSFIVVGLLDRAVAIYENGQAVRKALMFLSVGVCANSTLARVDRLPVECLPDDVEPARAFLADIIGMLEHDPHASVFGVPVKPTFRNVVLGYVATATAAVIGKFVFE